MAKVLNLDAVGAKEARELHLEGKAYAVREMSVGDFIETSRIAKKLEGETDFAVQMLESIKLIQRAVPDIDVAALERLNLEKLFAISRFVRGDDPEDITKALNKVIEEGDDAGNP